MAFPQVSDADTQSGLQTSNSNAWTGVYPTNLAAGDLILLIGAADGTSGTLTGAPTGWGTFQNYGSEGSVRLWCAAKVSDGTETGNFTISLAASEQGCWRTLRITGWWGTLSTGYTFNNLDTTGSDTA